jgi:RNA polymerase sigma factor (sigma-70 family)
MDDRETVAAIVAGDLDGLAGAYDRYAESLYGYCHWMLHDPADANDAVQDTFVIAAGRLGGLRDPRKLRPWLYAVARNECHRRLRTTEVGLDEVAGDADQFADAGQPPERAELRRLVRAALSGLSPDEREVLELGLRHDLHGADLAAVLGVTRHHAHALALRARGQLEKSVGALLVARTGRRACPNLDMMLTTWDGRLTVFARRRISRHVDQCKTCDDRRRGTLRPAALFGMAPLAALPPGLGPEVMRLCSDDSQQTMDYRQEVTLEAGPFGPNGFPQAFRPSRRRLVVLSRIAAAAGILVAIASTGIITALALGGSHAPHSLDAAQASGGSGTVSAGGNASVPGANTSAGPSASVSPTTTAPVTTGQVPAAVPSASSAKAKPSPSHTATTSAPAIPAPTHSTSLPTPTPTPTVTPTPTATGTPTATPTPTTTTTTFVP